MMIVISETTTAISAMQIASRSLIPATTSFQKGYDDRRFRFRVMRKLPSAALWLTRYGTPTVRSRGLIEWAPSTLSRLWVSLPDHRCQLAKGDRPGIGAIDLRRSDEGRRSVNGLDQESLPCPVVRWEAPLTDTSRAAVTGRHRAARQTMTRSHPNW
jgi:hypothetical protein